MTGLVASPSLRWRLSCALGPDGVKFSRRHHDSARRERSRVKSCESSNVRNQRAHYAHLRASRTRGSPVITAPRTGDMHPDTAPRSAGFGARKRAAWSRAGSARSGACASAADNKDPLISTATPPAMTRLGNRRSGVARLLTARTQRDHEPWRVAHPWAVSDGRGQPTLAATASADVT